VTILAWVSTTRPTEAWTRLLEAGRADERLVHEAFHGQRSARLAPIPPDLTDEVKQGLARVGIEALYEHQAQALEAAYERPVVITTGTASESGGQRAMSGRRRPTGSVASSITWRPRSS